MSSYNYDGFKTDDYEFDTEEGPAVGTKAPDAELTTSDGATKRLLDFDGDFLVLEMGSITCPLFQGRREVMEDLSVTFENVSSAILYVREAHPGTGIPAHKNFDEKQACAARLKNEDAETRLVLVDDFAGSTHQLYGSMPNAVFIINKHGCVVFRSDWNNPKSTKAALKSLINNEQVKVKSYFKPVPPPTVFKTLGRAGKGSTLEFFLGLPVLIWNNLVKRNLRLLFNKNPNVSANSRC